MLDWSYNLLDEPERATLHKLSWFVGAFSLKAAQFVVAGDAFKREEVVEAIALTCSKTVAPWRAEGI
jgi:predicted ATPase